MTVGQAFEVAYQAVIRARGHRSSTVAVTATGTADSNDSTINTAKVSDGSLLLMRVIG